MLKYKMTVPHVQLKISKMFCVLLMSLSLFYSLDLFCDTLERMQATSAHVCARVFSVEKIKRKEKKGAK